MEDFCSLTGAAVIPYFRDTFTINIVQVTNVPLPAVAPTLAGSPEAALGLRFLRRPFLSAMPD